MPEFCFSPDARWTSGLASTKTLIKRHGNKAQQIGKGLEVPFVSEFREGVLEPPINCSDVPVLLARGWAKGRIGLCALGPGADVSFPVGLSEATTSGVFTRALLRIWKGSANSASQSGNPRSRCCMARLRSPHREGFVSPTMLPRLPQETSQPGQRQEFFIKRGSGFFIPKEHLV